MHSIVVFQTLMSAESQLSLNTIGTFLSSNYILESGFGHLVINPFLFLPLAICTNNRPALSWPGHGLSSHQSALSSSDLYSEYPAVFSPFFDAHHCPQIATIFSPVWHRSPVLPSYCKFVIGALLANTSRLTVMRVKDQILFNHTEKDELRKPWEIGIIYPNRRKENQIWLQSVPTSSYFVCITRQMK